MAQRNYNQNNTGGNSLGDWLLPLIFLFFLPPVGVLLIVLKLFGGDSGRKRQVNGRHPYYTQQAAAGKQQTAPNDYVTGARTTEGQRQQAYPTDKKKKAADTLSPLAYKANRLTKIGGILALICLLIAAACVGDSAYWLVTGEPGWFMEDMLEILPIWCGLGGGAGVWWAGMRMKKKLRRFRQYMSTIGSNTTISISSLASATGRPVQDVREDLQDMLDEGYFPSGFLDYGGDKLVLSADGLKEQPKAAPKQKTITVEEAENAVLAEIKAVNDAISHEGMSAQIDRIGIITAKILDYQKSHPEKSPQLHSFLSYYLPTTLKILRAYAQLESQGIEGENITAAKQRIEGMMDKVVEGFEKQLDQLFQGDALDITTDVKVLEQMLSKDGLSSGDSLRLGL